MKRKIVILLLILSLLLPAVLTACNSNSSANGGANSGFQGGIFEGGSMNGGSMNGGSMNGGSMNGGSESGDQGADIPVENADILALSYDRLENADLSFNFDFGFGSSKANTKVSLSSLTEQDSGEYKYYSVSPEYLSEPTLTYDYFKDEESFLEALSKRARSTADFMIDNITVMNTAVSCGSVYYVLNYDGNSDTLYATTFSLDDSGDITDLAEIKIYYDNGGDETVEMFSLHSSEIETSFEYVLYTAAKRYTITRGIFPLDKNSTDSRFYHTTSAIKQDGMWRAVSMHFTNNNALLTKEGVYDYANGLLYLTFLIETEDNVYTFDDCLFPFRDGVELGSDVTAEAGDEVRINPTYIQLPGISVDIQNNGIFINGNVLTGWDEFRLTLDSDYEIPFTPYSEHYFNSDNDYLLLSNGVKLTESLGYWNDIYGWGQRYASDEGEFFIDSEGNHHKVEDGFCTAKIGGGITLINRKEGVLHYINLSASAGHWRQSYSERFNMLAKFFKAMDLGFVDGISDTLFADLSKLMVEREIYTGKVFGEVFGEDYTFEGYCNAIHKVRLKIDTMYSDANERYSSLVANGAISYDEQPKRPTNLELINVSGNLSGSATVTEGSIDFSSLTLTVAKSVILSEGSSYKTVVALVGSDSVFYIDAFEAVAYSHTDITVSGKSVLLPEVEAEGEYTAVIFFAKETQSGEIIRISDIAALPVADFTAFTTTTNVIDGYVTNDYEKKDGALTLKNTFVDTAAPEIILDGAIGRTEGENPVYTLTVGEGAATVGDLISLISATDKYDGNITVTVLNVTLSGSDDALFENYALSPDSAYVITVSDAAGNKSSVTVNTVEIPSAPAEGENAPKNEEQTPEE